MAFVGKNANRSTRADGNLARCFLHRDVDALAHDAGERPGQTFWPLILRGVDSD
jgi:hypothetical protein